MPSAARSRSPVPTGTGQFDQNINWTRTFGGNLINEFSYSYSIPGVHQRVHGIRSVQTEPNGHQLSLHLPVKKEDRGQDSACHGRYVLTRRRGPYPSSSEGPIHVFSNTRHSKGPPHVQGRNSIDIRAKTISIKSTSTRFRAARTTRTVNSRSTTAARRGRGSASRTWRWASSTTTAGSASAPSPSGGRGDDIFVQDRGRRAALTIEGGVR